MTQNRLRFSSASILLACFAFTACERSPHSRSDFSPPDLTAAPAPPKPDENGITTYQIPTDDGLALTFAIKAGQDDWRMEPSRRSNWRKASWQAAGSNAGVTVGYPIIDDLDILANESETPERREQAYALLTAVEFSTIAVKLANLLGFFEPRVLCGASYNPTRLERLWDYHVEKERRRPHFAGLMLKILEQPPHENRSHFPDSPLEFVDVGRGRALREIGGLLSAGPKSAGLSKLEFDSILPRLDLIAFDARQSKSDRLDVVQMLMSYGDPNRYVDLAIQLTADIEPLWKQASKFCFCTLNCTARRLTAANRRRYLRHCFDLLEKTDDGHSGSGSGLAERVGYFLELPPNPQGRDAFEPDRSLPQYQGSTGTSERFYQDTVNNARKWWSENRARFEPEA